jgi:hypothetical protein
MANKMATDNTKKKMVKVGVGMKSAPHKNVLQSHKPGMDKKITKK